MHRKLIVLSAGLFSFALALAAIFFMIDTGRSRSTPPRVDPPQTLVDQSDCESSGVDCVPPALSPVAPTEAPCTDCQPAASETFPDLVIRTNEGAGGIGTVPWDESAGRYAGLEFEPYSLVFDQGKIREMRSDETGGTMAVVTDFVAVADRLYVHVPSYHTVLALDQKFHIVAQASYGPGTYGGSLDGHIWTTASGAIVIFSNREFISFDAGLHELDRLTLDTAGPYLHQFSQVGDQLSFAEGVDTGPYTDCASVLEGGPRYCGERYTVSGSIDLRDPKQLRLVDSVKAEDMNPLVSPPFQSYDEATKTWLFITTKLGSEGTTPVSHQLIELREALKPERVLATLTVPDGTEVVGLTKTAPFQVITRRANRLALAVVEREGALLTLRTLLDLEWTVPSYQRFEGGVTMRESDGALVIAADSSVRVVRLETSPTLVLKQTLAGADGQSGVTMADFVLAPGFAKRSLSVDRPTLTTLLALQYYDAGDKRRLESQVMKLSPADTWAVPLLIAALKKKGGSIYASRPFFIRGLGNIGPAAVSAIPTLLDTTMEGAGILGDTVAPVAAALKSIDPTAVEVRAALKEFQSRQYESGAAWVSAEILKVYGFLTP